MRQSWHARAVETGGGELYLLCVTTIAAVAWPELPTPEGLCLQPLPKRP